MIQMAETTAQQVFDRLLPHIGSLLKSIEDNELAIILDDALLKLELWADEIDLLKGTLERIRHEEQHLHSVVVMVLGRLEKKITQLL